MSRLCCRHRWQVQFIKELLILIDFGLLKYICMERAEVNPLLHFIQGQSPAPALTHARAHTHSRIYIPNIPGQGLTGRQLAHMYCIVTGLHCMVESGVLQCSGAIEIIARAIVATMSCMQYCSWAGSVCVCVCVEVAENEVCERVRFF